MFIAHEINFAGKPFYFNGLYEVGAGSPYFCHANRYESREAAERAVAPWNSMGRAFKVREEATDETAQA
ncbi:hypothetical protein [Burkholderia multivorans]|uniref:hypothetical protein n=1 Tax=Burkholderia multivorans TaxID=87883 RepID=UPI0021C21CF7|nr:hypothetical protein [Burkholderia multivorans]